MLLVGLGTLALAVRRGRQHAELRIPGPLAAFVRYRLCAETLSKLAGKSLQPCAAKVLPAR